MDIRFQPEKCDVTAALRLNGSRRLIWIPLTMCLLGLFNVLLVALSKAGKTKMAMVQLLPLLVIAAIFLALWRWTEYAAWKNQRSGILSWHFGEDNIVFESDNARANFKWPALLRYKEGKEVFLLYPQKNVFHFIPKRALSEAEVAQFRELLIKHIPKK